MKRLEIEELRKTVKAKSKVRGEGGRNKKKNLTMLIVKQPNPKPARHFINDSTL
jgi:ATP-dependent DNA ligase